jgi:predicted ABC-type ATPase
MGGHASPEADIRAIFVASMANLSRAIEVFDYVECFNNSQHGGRPSRVLALIERRVVYRATPLPGWLGAFA